MSNLRSNLGQAIRLLRKAAGFSQEGFANACGIHRTYMGALERGERNVSLDNIAKVAAALGLPVSSLFVEAEALATRKSG
jgi:transcriptional regulator with XRE-family HTH domain